MLLFYREMMSSQSGGVSSHNNNTRSNVPDAATNVSGPSADRRKSGDFSISAILSEDTGGSSRKAKVTPVRGRERSTSSGMLVSPPGVLKEYLFAHRMVSTCTCIFCIYRACNTNVYSISLQSTLIQLTLHTNHCHTHFTLGN